MVKFGLKVKNKMSEFFLELFSEEIPPKLQINARKKILSDLNNYFKELITLSDFGGNPIGENVDEGAEIYK